MEVAVGGIYNLIVVVVEGYYLIGTVALDRLVAVLDIVLVAVDIVLAELEVVLVAYYMEDFVLADTVVDLDTVVPGSDKILFM